jgi:sortase A
VPVSSRSNQRKREVRVPLGLVFVTAGLIVLLAVVVVWALAPATLPARIAQAVAPSGLASQSAGPPVMAEAAPVGGAPAGVAVLLPGSPAAAEERPSFGSPETAPQAINVAPVTGQPIRLVVPTLDLDVPVRPVGLEDNALERLHFFRWQVPEGREVGWHESSALLGRPGNSVFNGHHNIHGEVFRDLIDLQIGDELFLYDLEREYAYRVDQIELLPETGQPLEVRAANARWIEPTRDERITLVTCWPYTGNSHRLIVVAQPAGSRAAAES